MSGRIEITSPAPILNTPDFRFAFGGDNGKKIPKNEKGHPHCFEFVALPGTIFTLIERCSEFIFRVAHPGYLDSDLFLDVRFAKAGQIEQVRKLPAKREILSRMMRLKGKPYVWGGNWSSGIPELLSFYPPKGELDEATKILWTLQGVDCSGLLYEAAMGASPRNTSQLVHFGNPLKIKGIKFDEILSVLEPLDLIVYPGHVLFVADSLSTIESKYPFGVIQRDLKVRFGEIFQNRTGVDEWTSDLDANTHFAIRRIS